ncbi:MFS transporter [Roseateles asaccharophilus]|uniref:MFS family arabinose efflux permease n=1 Tax=Roseateles asaccharophilus TaxID=582607 RepID=A0ABU2A5T9_9BURK|nr:MFS transporter [Roseateles asaccharophilus]MDR7332567.1 putative MFS family arabinose efflux permease [Roseateles asaccharophilus]
MSAPSVTGAAFALRTQFFVMGLLFATWGVHVPTVKAHYGLGEQGVALAMLISGVGALTALAHAGRIVGRHGPRVIAAVMGTASCAAIAVLIATPYYAGLAVAMLVFGACGSLFDVSLSSEASEIERLTGKPLMSGFHGMFSLGGMAGAGFGSLVPAMGLSAQGHLLLATGASAAAVLMASRFMLPVPDKAAAAEHHPLSLPRGPLLLLGVLAAMGLIAEGAIYDWSVLFMKQDRASDASTAALAYASFSGAMAAGRFGGDWVRARMQPRRLMRASGVLAAGGMALVLAVNSPWVSLLGYALVGLGLSNVVPVLFSAASQLPGVAPAHGIAAVAGVGYAGMMAGPPLIGLIAQHSSLTMGLLVVVVFAIFMALAAKRALRAA